MGPYPPRLQRNLDVSHGWNMFRTNLLEKKEPVAPGRDYIAQSAASIEIRNYISAARLG